MSGYFHYTLSLLAILFTGTSVAQSAQSLDQSLEFSGENRAQLEKALETIPGDDMEFLITTSRQYDLVNLTSEQLTDTLTYARRAYVEFPYIYRRIDHALWQAYVLPNRIIEEDLENWRPQFFHTLKPLVEKARNVDEAVKIVHQWMWERLEDGETRVKFVAAEDRNQSPLQLLETRKGGCKELHLLFVALLRSVGIPARHCTVTWWTNGDWFHYFMQYYDPDKGDWVSIEASTTQIRPARSWNEKAGAWKITKAYSFPSRPETVDMEGREDWEQAVDVTQWVVDSGALEVTFPGNKDFVASIYTFNLGAPRLLGTANSDQTGAARFSLSHTEISAPLIVAGVSGEKHAWQMVNLKKNETKSVALKSNDSPRILNLQKTD